MPPLNAAIITSRLPNISSTHSVSEITNNLKAKSGKIFGRISCHFFDRVPEAPGDQTNNYPRRTIETNYISTISSLIDKKTTPSQDVSDVNSTDFPQISAYADAQSDNYGLYALKCNRNAGGRARKGPAKIPPPIPPAPNQQQLLIAKSRDIVHEHFQPINRPSPISITIEPEQPRKQVLLGRSSHTPRRPCKGRAPTPVQRSPVAPLHRNIEVMAQRNISSSLILDTSILEPLAENAKELIKNSTEPYRIASLLTQHSSLDDSSCICMSRTQSTPQVAMTVCNQTKTPPNNKRKRLIKQFSTTESISIFGKNTLSDDAFDDFNEAISFEPIVPVSCANTTSSSLNPPSSFESDFAPLPPEKVCPSPSPKVNYAARFAAAFAEAFSEEEGIIDVDPPPIPTANPIHSTNELVAEPPLRSPNRVLHLRSPAKTSASPMLTSPSQQPELSRATNLITNFQSNPAHRDDNNTLVRGIIRAGDIAAKTTQFRTSSHPNQMKSSPQSLAQGDYENKTIKNSTIIPTSVLKDLTVPSVNEKKVAVHPSAIDNQFHHAPTREGNPSSRGDVFIVAVPSQPEATNRVNTASGCTKTTIPTRRTVYVMDI